MGLNLIPDQKLAMSKQMNHSVTMSERFYQVAGCSSELLDVSKILLMAQSDSVERAGGIKMVDDETDVTDDETVLNDNMSGNGKEAAAPTTDTHWSYSLTSNILDDDFHNDDLVNPQNTENEMNVVETEVESSRKRRARASFLGQ